MSSSVASWPAYKFLKRQVSWSGKTGVLESTNINNAEDKSLLLHCLAQLAILRKEENSFYERGSGLVSRDRELQKENQGVLKGLT